MPLDVPVPSPSVPMLFCKITYPPGEPLVIETQATVEQVARLILELVTQYEGRKTLIETTAARPT